MNNKMLNRTMLMLAASSLILSACAPKPLFTATEQERNSNDISELGRPDFSGKVYPVTTDSTSKAGSCADYTTRFKDVGGKFFPIPLEMGSLWSYLIPVREDKATQSVTFASQNNGANMAKLYVNIRCEPINATPRLTVTASGPMTADKLHDISKRFLQEF